MIKENQKNMPKGKQNAIVAFLSGKAKLDTVKTSAIARKQDSKDKAENAKRYLSQNSRYSSKLNDLIESLKTKMFSDVKASYGLFLAKDTLTEMLIESDCLNGLKCIGKTKANLMRDLKVNEISDAEFLTALKVAFTNHESTISASKKAKQENYSDKVKAILNPQAKAQAIEFITKANKPKAKGAKA